MTYDSFVQGKPLRKRLLPATEMIYDSVPIQCSEPSASPQSPNSPTGQLPGK